MCLLSSCGSLLQLLWISKWILTQTCLYFDNSLSRYKTETLCLTYLVLLENFLALHTFVSLFPGSYKNNLNSLSSTKAKKIEQQHILSAVLNSSYTMESPWRCLQIHCFPPPTDKRFFFFPICFQQSWKSVLFLSSFRFTNVKPCSKDPAEHLALFLCDWPK